MHIKNTKYYIVVSHQRRLHRATYTSQAWWEGFLSRRTQSLEPAADQTENVNL